MKEFKPISDSDRKYHSKTLEHLQQEMKSAPWNKKLKLWWNLQVWSFNCDTRFIWDSTYEYFIFRQDMRFKAAFYTMFPSLMPQVWQTTGTDNPTIYKYNDDEGYFVGFNMIRLSIKYVVNNLEPRKK